MTAPDPVIHFEMPYQNEARVAKFYADSFGWNMSHLGADFNNYVHAETTELEHGLPAIIGAIHGGFFPKSEDPSVQVPSVVIGTSDIISSMLAVSEAGGTVLGEPLPIPGVGKYVSFLDSEGNRVSLLEPDGPCAPSSDALRVANRPPQQAKIATCLWFDGLALDAAEFYVSLLPNSKIGEIQSLGQDGPPLLVHFSLAGAPYQALNGGPEFKHSEAASISVTTDDQAETDRLWSALTAYGGEEGSCGWLVDRFGLSWQIVPKQMSSFLFGEDMAGTTRAMQAMMTMGKIDIAVIEAAYKGELL